MRILQVLPSFDPNFGGPVASGRAVTVALRTAGHEVLSIAPSCLPDAWPGPNRAFSTFAPIGSTSPSATVSPSLIYWVSSRLGEFDAIHLHLNRSPTNLLLARIIARRRIPYVVQTHGMCTPWTGVKRAIDSLGTRNALRGAAAILVLSDIEKNDLAARDHLKSVYVLDNAICADVPALSIDPPSIPHFLFFARLHPRKGVEVFIRAAAIVARRHRECRFTVVGPDEGARPKAEALARSAGVNVDFVGLLGTDAIARLLVNVSAMVHPAEDEPFGMAMLEALWNGAPLIAAASSILAPRIRSGTDSRLIARGDVVAYADAMSQVVDLSPDHRRSEISKGQDWAVANFSVEKLAENLASIYSSSSILTAVARADRKRVGR